MAITANADIRYIGGFAAGTNTTTIVRANADLANVQEDDFVWNETRGFTMNIVKKVVGATNTTLTLTYAIPSQTTTDTMTFIPSIRVSGYKYTSTASSGTSTTLTKTAAGWTVNAFTDYIVYIISGTGAGASAVIKSNTSTVLTVEAFYKPNQSGTLVTTVTPDATSVFGIAYNYADIIAAVPTFASWFNVTSVKTLKLTKGLVIAANSGLADFRKDVQFTTPYTGFFTRQTSFLQFGKLTNSKTGFDGGYIHLEHPYTVDYNQTIELRWEGKVHFYGALVVAHKGYADTVNSGFRWNTYTPGLNTLTDYTINYDGVYVFNSEFRRLTCTTWSTDIWYKSKNSQARINVYRIPPVFSGTEWTEANMIIAGGQPVVMDGDVFDLKSVGEALSPAFSRPLSPYQTTLANDCIYLWRANLGNYTLANSCDWSYLSGTGNEGRFIIGGTLRTSTKTAAGANLGAVAVGLIKTSDGTGQIVINKTGTNHAPGKKRFIVTDANGAYTGPYGVGEGIMFHYATLSYGGSPFVTTVTDYSGYNLIFNKYGYKQQILSRSYNYTDDNAEIGYMIADPYIVASYATAIAYSGISANLTTKALTISGNLTPQQVYDWFAAKCEYEAVTNDVHFVNPMSTSDGVTFTLAADWSVTISGSLVDGTKRFIGTKTISSGGLFEDSTGAIWNTSGTLYYASKINHVVKVGGVATDNIRIAYVDSGNVNRTYNSSRVAVNNLNSAAGGLISGYVVWKIGTTTYSGHKCLVREYEYQLADYPTTVNGTPISSDIGAIVDSFVSASEAVAGAYTGIAANYSTPAATVTASHTVQKLYDYLKYNHIQPTNYDKSALPLVTSNGLTFQFATNWNLVVGASGNVTEVTKTVAYTGTGSLVTSSGGVFEDATRTQWEAGGTVYKASHFYTNVKAITGGANIQSAIVAYINSSGVDVTYNTSRVNGAISTDASGNAEGYVVYAIGATVNSSITQQIGEYSYIWSNIPKTVSGQPIGLSGAYETVRLVTDNAVTLTKANALLVSGITVSQGTKDVDINSNTLSEAYDNLKARQAAVAEIETGIKGYMCYYADQLLVSEDGTIYTSPSDWTYSNVRTDEAGVFRNGIIVYPTPGTYSQPLYNATIEFTSAGTYDMRNASFTGTITLINSSGGSVVAQLHPDHVYTNTGPNITIEASVAVEIAVNGMENGSRFQLYDVSTDTELINGIADGSEAVNYTYSEPTAIRLRVMKTGFKWYEVTGLTSAIGLAFNVSQQEDAVYTQNGVDGSTVTECSVSGSTIRIYVDDPDNQTTWQRIYNWYMYYLTTEDGIRNQDGDAFTAIDGANYVMDTSLGMKVNNQDSSNPLSINGAICIPKDGGSPTSILDATGGTILGNTYHATTVIVSTSGEAVAITPEQLAAITPPAASTIADAVLDEALGGHTTAGTLGKKIADIPTTGGGATAEEVRQEIDNNSTMLKKINNGVGGLY